MSDSEEETQDTPRSDAETDTVETSGADLKMADARLSQVRRAKEKRGGLSKVRQRYQGLMSYEDMLKAHALQRMKDGLRNILKGHTAVELSSICGCLHLKTQQKASTSVEQIISFASDTEEMVEAKTHRILNFMWEGALWEYLHSLGHPVHPITIDPKVTILQLWQRGGLAGSEHSFVPHFVAREVQKRYDWVQAKDIKERLDKLRELQEITKVAERKVISDHDYTQILNYFTRMAELRRYENSAREYFIQELEIARSRVDSASQSNKMNREDLEAAEIQLIKIAEALNEKVIASDFVAEQQMEEKIRMEKDLQRLVHVVDSYIAAEEMNVTPGSEPAEAFKMRDLKSSCKSIQTLHKKMTAYRDMRDMANINLRERARNHVDEIDRLEITVRELEDALVDTNNDLFQQTQRADKAEKELASMRRMLAKSEIRQTLNTQESWGSAARFASKAKIFEYKLHAVKPLLIAGMRNSNKAVNTICNALMKALDFVDEDEKKRIQELIKMDKADKLAWDIRTKEYLAANAAAEAAAKGAKGGKKGAKSKGGSKKKIAMQKPKKGSGAAGGAGSESETDGGGSVATKSSKVSKSSATKKKKK